MRISEVHRSIGQWRGISGADGPGARFGDLSRLLNNLIIHFFLVIKFFWV